MAEELIEQSNLPNIGETINNKTNDTIKLLTCPMRNEIRKIKQLWNKVETGYTE